MTGRETIICLVGGLESVLLFPIDYVLVEGAITSKKQVSKTTFDSVLTSKTMAACPYCTHTQES